MPEKKIVVAEGEEACKLLDCFVAYNKLAGATNSNENQPELFTVGVLPTPELKVAAKSESRV